MVWMLRAGLAAVLLNCVMSSGFAAPVHDTKIADAKNGQWLKDASTACSLFDADAHPGDSASWNGACVNGFADGLGTAAFTHDGQSQSFTAVFAHGAITDGAVITRWGRGWSYDGEAVGGRFNGSGVLTTDASDRFEGQWVDGKMNGFGILRRAGGERYAGDWKNDQPNGSGELRHADGSLVSGQFVDGKLTQISQKSGTSAVPPTAPSGTPFGGVAGKTLTGIDGSSIALNLIEGGMELQLMPADGNARKTTFTFMTDKMGTVVEDSDAPGAGTSVTGFFRLTGKGIEVRYADGRSAMLSANGDGGVQMVLESDKSASCRSWYPQGHAFSDADKKAALNAYASKLGLAATASASNSCSPGPVAANAALPPAGVKTPASKAHPAPHVEHHAEIKAPASAIAPTSPVAKASYRIGDYQPPGVSNPLQAVAVRASQVHMVDAGDSEMTPAKNTNKSDASTCLKVDSDGGHWGFRNACGFAVQFAYCMAQGRDSLTACSADAPVSIAGSVAAGGFGALMPDTSLKEKDGAHNFRWIACGGGAGEVVAHLDHFEPPGGRCERTRTASAN